MGGRTERRVEHGLSQGLQEGEIREDVARCGYAYLPLRLWGDKADRTYLGMDLLLLLIRDELCYRGVISVHLGDDPRLARNKIVGSGQLGWSV